MEYLPMFLIFLVTYKELETAKTAAPRISPVSLTSCEGTEKIINLEYRTVGKDGQKAWFGNATTPVTIDANTEFVFEFRWWKDGDWEKSGPVFKGKVCFYLQKFAAKLWKEVRAAAKPPIEPECLIKPGTYSFDNYVADYSGASLPMMKKGRWSGKITITKDGKLLCGILIVDMI